MDNFAGNSAENSAATAESSSASTDNAPKDANGSIPENVDFKTFDESARMAFQDDTSSMSATTPGAPSVSKNDAPVTTFKIPFQETSEVSSEAHFKMASDASDGSTKSCRLMDESNASSVSSISPAVTDETSNLSQKAQDDKPNGVDNAAKTTDENSSKGFDEVSNSSAAKAPDETSNLSSKVLEETSNSSPKSMVSNTKDETSNVCTDLAANTPSNNKTEAAKKGSVKAPAESTAKEVEEEEEEEHGFPPEKLFEFQWPPDKSGEWWMLQEQVSEYLGILSFKRKYPDIERRSPLDVKERIFLREKNIVTEMQCDLGLTAVKSYEVCDLMARDYPDMYAKYQEVLRERERKKIRDRHNDYAQANVDKSKMDFLIKKAVKAAADFNSQFNRERKEERKAYFDLQTLEIHYPQSRMKKLTPEETKVGAYPVALIPGQFQDYFRKYTPQQLKYFPLNTAVYEPPKSLKTIFADPLDANETEEEKSQVGTADESGDSSSSSGSESSSDSSDSEEEEDEGKSEVSSQKSGTGGATPAPTAALPPATTSKKRGKKRKHEESTAGPSSQKEKEKDTEIIIPPLYIPEMVELACDPPPMCHTCQNEKTVKGEPEELVHCSECGRFGHPTCLELTDEMIPNIKTYNWQCMECKTCVKCMDPYDEDKMMFCDHCDRGYHTFCVGLRSIPTGRWECPSCRKDDKSSKGKNGKKKEDEENEESSEEEEEEEAPVKRCKCGSKDHERTNNRNCPLYSGRKSRAKKVKDEEEKEEEEDENDDGDEDDDDDDDDNDDDNDNEKEGDSDAESDSVVKCKCGSTDHQRTSNRACPLYKPRKSKNKRRGRGRTKKRNNAEDNKKDEEEEEEDEGEKEEVEEEDDEDDKDDGEGQDDEDNKEEEMEDEEDKKEEKDEGENKEEEMEEEEEEEENEGEEEEENEGGDKEVEDNKSQNKEEASSKDEADKEEPMDADDSKDEPKDDS